MVTLQSLNFDNAALRELPVDPNPNQDVRANVPGCCYSLVKLQPVEGPRLVCASKDAFALLGLDLSHLDDEELAKYFSGNRVLAGSETYAHCYCGYQFGFFSGQLGDGAATSLGEVVTADGKRWELQLKGAGKTPYSRQGDGRKVLRSSLREFLCSEAMHYLGIPTTRAGCVVTSSTRVERDMFYTGNVKMEPASIVLRLAPTFMRFGSFEIFKMREESNTDRGGPSSAHPTLLPRMMDFLIFYHFPELWRAAGGGDTLEAAPGDKKEMYVAMFEQVVTRTATLVAAWQCVGFCHGVLNTDNMSMLGLTLDYGPFGFLDRYNEHHISNTSDDQGRYSFSAQPQICEWNCRMLGEALRQVLPRAEAKQVLAKFWPAYNQAFHARMRAKLGLVKTSDAGVIDMGAAGEGSAEDGTLIQELLEAMQATGVDFTNTFRALRRIPMPAAAPVDTVDMTSEGSNGTPSVDDGGFLDIVLADCCSPQEAVDMIGSRFKPQQIKMLAQFALREPGLLVAMGITPQEVQREQEKADMARALADTTPEAKAASDRSTWTQWVHKYAKRLYLERQAGTTPEERIRTMNQSNPRIVLRNWVAQVAIERAEDGDFSLAKRVLKLLEQPFDEYSDSDLAIDVKAATCGDSQATVPWRLDLPPPPVFRSVRVSCSS